MDRAAAPSSNKTGLVLKISLVLFILLATVVYKLNDNFKNEKLLVTESQLRNKVVLIKTSVTSQLSQLKNVLSSYETELTESNVNWVQLEPFFAVARVSNIENNLKVNELLLRSNTPAEHWNKLYLENALSTNKSDFNAPTVVQLFQDKPGNRFLLIRFKIGRDRELVVAGFADYFQKFFDIERGESGKSLLVTVENILAAHSEGDYVANRTEEMNFMQNKYLIEKEEIVGTNLIAMNYVLKNKMVKGFVLPWSILGIVTGFGCIFIAILFYSIDPIERKIEYYKRQERARVYKDTLSNLTKQESQADKNNPLVLGSVITEDRDKKSVKVNLESSVSVENSVEAFVVDKKNILMNLPKGFYSLGQAPKEVGVAFKEEVGGTEFSGAVKIAELNKERSVQLDGHDMDLVDIEKALSLDDFETSEEETSGNGAELLKKNLSPQKISIFSTGVPVSSPQFSMIKKDFKVDEIKISIRRPEIRHEKHQDSI